MMASNVKVWDVYGNMKGTLEGPGPEGDIVVRLIAIFLAFSASST